MDLQLLLNLLQPLVEAFHPRQMSHALEEITVVLQSLVPGEHRHISINWMQEVTRLQEPLARSLQEVIL